MENIIKSKLLANFFSITKKRSNNSSNLVGAKLNTEYTISRIDTKDEEIKGFLFTLGCYEGEKVTVISILADNYVIAVNGARYSIDWDLARIINI